MSKFIPLTKGYVAKIDDEDFEKVAAFKWCASIESKYGKRIYAIRWVRLHKIKKKIKIRMHRFILGLDIGLKDARVVDHLDNDGLNNTKANLKIVANNHENMSRHETWKKKKDLLPNF